MLQVWERLDEEVATTPMPREYCNWQVLKSEPFAYVRRVSWLCHCWCADTTHAIALVLLSTPTPRIACTTSVAAMWLNPFLPCTMQVELLCNDCQQSSRVRFHIVGQKCPAEKCGSYNTRRVTIIRIPADAAEDAIPELPPPQQQAAPPADA